MNDEQLLSTYNSARELSLDQESVASFSDLKESNKSEYSGDTDFETIFHDYHSVINCLKSEPFQRSTNDIKVLIEFFQTIPEFIKFSDTQLELACQAAYLQIVKPDECLVKKFNPFKEWMFILDGSLIKIDDDETIIKPGFYFGVDFFTDDVKISFSDIVSSSSLKPCSLLVLTPACLNSPSNHNRQILKYGRDCSSFDYETSDSQPKSQLIAMYDVLSSPTKVDGYSNDASNITLDFCLAKAAPAVLINNTLASDIPWLPVSFLEDVIITMSMFKKHTNCARCGGLNIENVLNQILMLADSHCSADNESSEIVNLSNLKIVHVFRVLLCAFPIIDGNVNLRRAFFKTIDRMLRLPTSQSSESYYLFLKAATISSKVRQYDGVSLQSLRCRLKRISEPFSFLSVHTRRRQLNDEPSLYYVMNYQATGRSNTLCKKIKHDDDASDLEEDGIHEGDLIVGIDRYGRDEMTESLMDMLCSLEQNKDCNFTVFVRNDLLGYHQHVMGNISNSMFLEERDIPNNNGPTIRSCSSSTNSINSTPSNSQYSRSLSDKQDISLEEGRQEPTCQSKEQPTPQVKRPTMFPLPSLSHLFVGSNNTVGRLFMKKHMKKDAVHNNKSISRRNSCLTQLTLSSLTTEITPTRSPNILSSSTFYISRDSNVDSIANQNMAKISGSSLSLLKLGSKRFRSKASSIKKRRSAGSNPDLCNEFPKSPGSGMLDSPTSNSSFNTTDSSRKTFRASSISTTSTGSKYPIRIFWRTELLARPVTNQEVSNIGNSSASLTTPTTSSASSSTTPAMTPLRKIHLHIDASTCVNETVIRALLQLDLSSASSSEYFLVQVSSTFTTYDQSVSVREKILRPSDSNLVQRIRDGCGFFLKHKTCVGKSWITQQEIEKTILPQSPSISMQHNLSSISVLDLPVKQMAIRLFQLSHRMIARLHPAYIISSLVATNDHNHHQEEEFTIHKLLLDEYMSLSNIFKFWTVWEIVRNPNLTPSKRALTIHYFVTLALNALQIGHIDLFFNVLSGLESVEVSRLTQTWSKVHDKYKKILASLRNHLDVSGNLRNLRTLHQKFQCPYIPVTAIHIKDISFTLETHSTWISSPLSNEEQGVTNEQSNNADECLLSSDLININKLTRLASYIRQFCVTPICDCEFQTPDIRRVTKIHNSRCIGRQPENEERILEILYSRMHNSADPIASSPVNNNCPEYPFRNPIKSRHLSSSSIQNQTSKPTGTNTNSIQRKLSVSSASSDNSMQEQINNGYYVNSQQQYHRNHSFSTGITNGISSTTSGISSQQSSNISSKQYQKLTSRQFADFSFLCSIDTYIDTIIYPHKTNTDTISNNTNSPVTIETSLVKLMEMSHNCEPPPAPQVDSSDTGFSVGDMKGMRQSKRQNKLNKHQNSQENIDQFPLDIDALNISDKAAEILGLKEKSAMFRYKKREF